MSKKEDFRKLSIDAQAFMRKVALKLVKRYEKQSSVADVIGVSRQTISEWVTHLTQKLVEIRNLKLLAIFLLILAYM